MGASRASWGSLRPLGLAVVVLLAAGGAWGQTTWTKYEFNPVLERGAPGEWDAGVVDHSEVLFDGVTYHMWYAGGLALHSTDIGYATSTDGVTWTKHDANPVLLRGAAGEWDAGSLQPGAVLWDGALYHMWYGAGAVPGGAGVWPTGYATSTDGVTWTKHPANPVLPVGAAGSWDSQNALITAVASEGGTYRAWYWGYQTLSWVAIGYATSPDGVTWTRWPEPVFWPRTSGWDSNLVLLPTVVLDGDVYRMWYSGGRDGCYGIGHAVSRDGLHWARQPLWEPVLDIGGAGSWWERDCVFSPRVVLGDGTAHMWYNGANYATFRFAIGYASGPLPLAEAWLFADDFESADTSTWSSSVP